LYSWDYLYQLGREQEARWAEYLARLTTAGYCLRGVVLTQAKVY
jgi:DUF971 family protein